MKADQHAGPLSELHPNVIENLRRHEEILRDSPVPGWLLGMVAAHRIASASGCLVEPFVYAEAERLMFKRFWREAQNEIGDAIYAGLCKGIDDLLNDGRAVADPAIVVAECYRCGRRTAFGETIGAGCRGEECAGKYIAVQP